MFIVQVSVHVKPDRVAAFKTVVLENARNSVQEPGVVRFDVIQQQDDPTRFMLVEVYRSDEAQARHKETAHYLAWRDAVADLQAEPRTSLKYNALFPDEAAWEMPASPARPAATHAV